MLAFFLFRHTTRTDFSSHFKMDFESRKCYFWKPGVEEKTIFHARAHSRDRRGAKKKKEKFSTSFRCSSNSRKKPISSSPSWPTLSKQPKILHFSVIDFAFFFGSRRKVFIFVFCVSEKFVFRLFFFFFWLCRNDLGCARSRSSNNK